MPKWSLKYKEVKKILECFGYELQRETQHHIFLNAETGVAFPVPGHNRNAEIAPGTLSNIIRQSCRSRGEWEAIIDNHFKPLKKA